MLMVCLGFILYLFVLIWLLFVLVSVFIAMKRHHDHSNSYKETFNGGLTVSEFQSIIIMVGSMVAGRQMRCWS